MSASDIATLLTAAAALAGAVVTWLMQRHRPALDRQQARIAEAQATSAVHTADLDVLRGIIAELRTEIEQLRARVDRAEIRATRAEAYIAVLLETWGTMATPPPQPPTITHEGDSL